MDKNRIRVPRDLRDICREVAEFDEVQESVSENGPLIETAPYNQTLDTIIPDEPDEDEVMEWDMVAMHGVEDEVYDRVQTLAGECVPAHQVVRRYLAEWMIENGYDDPRTERRC